MIVYIRTRQSYQYGRDRTRCPVHPGDNIMVLGNYVNVTDKRDAPFNWYFNGKQLNANKSFQHYNIKDKDVIETNLNPLALAVLYITIKRFEDQLAPGVDKHALIQEKEAVKVLYLGEVPYLGEQVYRFAEYTKYKLHIDEINNVLEEYRLFDKKKEDPLGHFISRVHEKFNPDKNDYFRRELQELKERRIKAIRNRFITPSILSYSSSNNNNNSNNKNNSPQLSDDKTLNHQNTINLATINISTPKINSSNNLLDRFNNTMDQIEVDKSMAVICNNNSNIININDDQQDYNKKYSTTEETASDTASISISDTEEYDSDNADDQEMSFDYEVTLNKSKIKSNEKTLYERLQFIEQENLKLLLNYPKENLNLLPRLFHFEKS
ncbi:hypothetical protein CYY_003923 [Polysphondylium violaceum]|uniref:Uncharacterized protein n=1 Tax=Polysphondylium violaceum TaxID=133409 RepID=A0A8J4V5M8_9MYCE|nr:hypothetical protein CYY_003923 [Polysphondylium violaceum]